MGSMFQKAKRQQVFLRMMLLGISGAGKTYSALGIARGLAGDQGRIAVLDSERGSSRLYSDTFGFEVAEIPDIEIPKLARPEGRYAPERYIAGIKAAEAAGYSVLVIDSLTHAWNGEGGVMEIVDHFGQGKFKGNAFAAWSIATPIWRQLLDTMISARLHIIVTGRSKTEWLEVEAKSGKKNFERVGTKAELREGAEFEFDLVGELDLEHYFRVIKTRYSVLNGEVIPRPGQAFGAKLHAWLRGEKPVEASSDDRAAALYRAAKIDFATATEFCNALRKPRPLQMDAETFGRFVEYISAGEGRDRIERWLYDNNLPRITSEDPSGWPADEAAELYAKEVARVARPGQRPAAPAPGTATGTNGQHHEPRQPQASARPAAAHPASTSTTGAPSTPAPAGDPRVLLARLTTERQVVGDGVYLDACAAEGVDPARPGRAGSAKVAAVLARLEAAQQPPEQAIDDDGAHDRTPGDDEMPEDAIAEDNDPAAAGGGW